MFVEREKGNRTLGRRVFFLLSGGALAALIFHEFDNAATNLLQAAPDQSAKMVTIVEFTDSGEQKDVIAVPHDPQDRRRVEKAVALCVL